MKNIKINTFAAIDLGSNNCRLRIVELKKDKIRNICNFSNEIKLGENLSFSNEFTDKKIQKTIFIFEEISKKFKKHNVEQYRCIATQACREAINSETLIKKVFIKTGIKIEVITPEEEAKLCLLSCLTHKNLSLDYNFVFDIGGGSTEIIYTKSLKRTKDFVSLSIPLGVINLDKKIDLFSENKILEPFKKELHLFKDNNEINEDSIDMIGSCSTITTLCAIFQDLKYYQKKSVDEFIFNKSDLYEVMELVNNMTEQEKINNPMIGLSRIKLFENGIKILKLILNIFKVKSIFVSDRGIKEGIIWNKINENNYL